MIYIFSLQPILSEETATSAENINSESHPDECIYVPDEVTNTK